MIQRLELAHADGLVGIRTSNNGDYVLYTDHIAETRKLIDTYDLLISQEDKKIAELEAENKRLREALDDI